MSVFKKSIVVTLALFSVINQAEASIMNFTFGNYLPGSTLTTFDSLPVGTTNVSLTLANLGALTLNNEAQIVQGTTSTHADPYYDKNAVNGLNPPPSTYGPDTTPYISVYTGGTATFSLIKPDHYFGLEWGSVDTYNELTFYDGKTMIGQFGGATIINAANLIAGNQGTKGTVYVNFTSALKDPITKVVASSSGIAFEFDNVRVSQQPLPASLPMFVAAMMVMGALGFRSRKALAAA